MESVARVTIGRRAPDGHASRRLRGAQAAVDDERFMAMALELARRGIGRTAPNPPVGAVLVRHGRVVGAGFHRRAGAPHAEIEALRRAGEHARGATLYVTLEPCNHTGRTPPCCDAILASGIARVVAATTDPNPITHGRGFSRLRRARVPVTRGVLEASAEALIAPFRKAVTTGLPLAIGKIGQSLDGKIATSRGESRWITSPAARRRAQALRHEADAILVGITTVLRDNPRLTARGRRDRPGRPIRVVVDSRLRIPLSARCLSGGPPALIATTWRAARSPKGRALIRRGVDIVALPSRQDRVPLTPLFQALARRGLHTVLVEGGGEVLAGALSERLLDRAVWFIAPRLIGGRSAPGSLGGTGVRRLADAAWLDDVTVSRAGPDICVEGRVVYPR